MDLVTDEPATLSPAAGNQGRRAALVVLGMHRTGTSALSGVLHKLGAGAPANLQWGDKDNERGYWESQRLVQLNDRILKAGDSRWNDWAAFDDSRLDPAQRAALEAEMLQAIDAEYGGAPLIAIKDPRMCRLMPLWLRALDRLGFEVKFVIPVRNPLETALSLLERDKMPVEEGLLLWLRHMLDAVRFSRGHARCFVAFADLLEDWRASAERIAAQLQIAWPVEAPAAAGAVEQFLSRELRHHARAPQDLNLHAGAIDWVVEAYDLLGRLSTAATPAAAHLEALEALRSRFEEGARAFAPLIRSRDTRLAQMAARIETIERGLAERTDEARQAQADLAATKAALADQVALRAQATADADTQRLQLVIARQALDRLAPAGGRDAPALHQVVDRLRGLIAGPRKKARHKKARRERDAAALIRASGLFDAAWYLETYADVRKAGIDPALHYLRRGAIEGRNPSIHFSTRAYQNRYLDVATSGGNPLLHFLSFGRSEGRRFEAVDSYAGPRRGGAPAQVAAAEGGVTAEHLRFTRPGPDHEDLDPAILGGATPDVKLIAYYLPQYHPIPENDRNWGKGFTEWRQVSRGLPRFPGHYQPRLPSDLGFYDLRDVAVMRRQAEMAKAAGIHAFAFYYYWFDGQRVLERPVDNFLATPDVAMPFMLIWANENWTRTWDGMNGEILLRQSYETRDETALLADLARHFRDPRYLRLEGRPLFVIYQPKHVPEAKATFARWRARWKDEFGLEPAFFMAQTFGLEDPEEFGLDGAFEFPPHNLQKLYPGRAVSDAYNPDFNGKVIRYDDVVTTSLAKPAPSYPLVKTLFPSWDNDARRPMRGATFEGSTPRKYQNWLTELVRRARARPILGASLVAVNAWNEWAEGAYLEPDIHFGAAYLNATSRALLSRAAHASPHARFRVVLVGHDTSDHGAQRLLLSIGGVLARRFGIEIRYLLLGGGPLLPRYQEIAPCTILAPEDDAAVAAAIAALAGDGFALALTNTTVSGKIGDHLKAAQFRIVSLVHELPGLIESYQLEQAVSAIGRNSDVAVFASDMVLENFRRLSHGFAGKALVKPQGLYRAEIAPDPAAAAQVRAELGLPPQAKLVINVGYGDHRKGYDLFTQAAELAAEHDPDIRFIWIGKLPGTGSAAKAPRAGKGDVLAIGHREDVSPYYAAADLFFLSSREDPYPSVVLEAMAAGLPVIGFAGATGCEALIAQHGVLVPAGDLAAVVGAIRRLLTLDGESARIAAAARLAEIRANYDFKDYCFWLLQQLDPTLSRVSVLVPNYNHARYLPARMESIFAQHYPAYEVVVLDDASPDDSLEVLRGAAAEAGRDIVLLPNDVNSGSLARQWRKGLGQCTGEYVWIAESDDVASAEFLSRTVEMLEREKADVCFTDSWQIDGDDVRTGDSYIPYADDIVPGTFRRDFAMSGADFLRRFLAVKNVILNMSGVLWRRSALIQALDAASPEIETLRLAGDWKLYASACLLGQRVAYLAEALNGHRRHARGVTSSLDTQRHVDEVLRVQTAIVQEVELDEDTLARAARHLDDIHRHLGLEKRDDLMSIADIAMCREAASPLEVRPEVDPSDFIFRFLLANRKFPDRRTAIEYYFRDGRKSAESLRSLLADLGHPDGNPASLLEFASGYGCVTRHAARVFPRTAWTASDIHPDAMTFIARRLSVPTQLSAHVPEALRIDGRFDVVFALSFFSHMPERTWGRWLKALHSLVRPGGHLVFTTHGATSAQYFGNPEIPASGLWFKTQSEQKDLDTSEYGQTIVTPDFVARAAREFLGQDILVQKLGHWWLHQDLYVIRGAG
jgi:SAM-dependent methyltransferase